MNITTNLQDGSSTTTIITTATTVPNPRFTSENMPHIPGKGNNIETALLEAYHLIGCERNGDIVSMTSYAPLLAKDRRTRWRPDLIYFNNMEVKPGTSYYTQLLFGQNSGNEYIPSVLTLSDNRDDVRKRIGISVVKDSLSQDLILKIVNLLPGQSTG